MSTQGGIVNLGNGGLLSNSVETPFYFAAPKANRLLTIKLSPTNIRRVAAYILRTLGGIVRVDDNEIGTDQLTLKLGDWVVEDYHYAENQVFFRVATLAERKEFDLR